MLDINVFIQSFSNVYADTFFKYLSLLITDIPLVLVLSYIYWCVNKKNAFKAGVILLTSMQLNFILKNIFRIDRPYVKNENIINKDVEYGYGYSFPSNHSQISATILTLFNRYLNMGKYLILGIVLVFGIAFSRVYLGVHSVLDVACGLFFGWLISATLAPIVEKIMEKNKYLILLFAIFGLISGFLQKDHDGIKILLLFAGFVFGYFVEIKYIDYKIPKKFQYNIINYFAGIVGVALIYILIPGEIKYVFIGLWVTLLAPFVFSVIRKGKNYEHKEN